MRKAIATATLFGILAFGYHHFVKPVAKGFGKAANEIRKVVF